MSAGAVKRGVAQIAAEFERVTGNRVAVEFTPVPEVRRRINAGEAADVIVATPAAMDEFAAQERIAHDSRGYIGRSRMGVVVHADAPVPQLDDSAAFTRVLLSASEVVRNEASSGIYTVKLLDRLGLTPKLGSRIIVVKTGAGIMEYVAAHPSAVGLAQISEIMVMVDKGCKVKLAAPLPEEIQNATSYEAAAATASESRDAARALARELAGPEAKKIFAATGISE